MPTPRIHFLGSASVTVGEAVLSVRWMMVGWMAVGWMAVVGTAAEAAMVVEAEKVLALVAVVRTVVRAVMRVAYGRFPRSAYAASVA